MGDSDPLFSPCRETSRGQQARVTPNNRQQHEARSEEQAVMQGNSSQEGAGGGDARDNAATRPKQSESVSKQTETTPNGSARTAKCEKQWKLGGGAAAAISPHLVVRLHTPSRATIGNYRQFHLNNTGANVHLFGKHCLFLPVNTSIPLGKHCLHLSVNTVYSFR